MVRKIALLLFLLLGLVVTASPQTLKKTPVGGTSPTAQALTALENKWVGALQEADTATLDSILADTYVDTSEEGQRSDKKSILSALKSGQLKFESVTVSDMKVYSYGAAAVVTGSGAQRGTFQDQRLMPRIVFTDTFVRQQGKWRAVASHRSASPPQATVAGDEARIRALYERWTQAFEARDIDGIMSLYAEDVVAYDVVPPLQYKGKDAYRKDYLEFLAQYDGPVHVELREIRVFNSGDVGLIHALERFTGKLTNGQPSDLWLRATSGARKIDGKWLIIHDHLSVPVDFATGKAVLELKPQ